MVKEETWVSINARQNKKFRITEHNVVVKEPEKNPKNYLQNCLNRLGITQMKHRSSNSNKTRVRLQKAINEN